MVHEPIPGEEPMFQPEATATAAVQCAWCGEPAVVELELEKPRYTKDHHGIRQMAKRAITAKVCRAHLHSLAFADGRVPPAEGIA